MALEIRLARPEEYDAVGRITRDAYAASGHLVAEDFYEEHLLDAASRATEAELYVAAQQGDAGLLGTVTFCTPGSPWSELARSGEGEFRMLAVAPSARRRGVARALVGRCVERARELELAAIVISSLPVAVESHGLYAEYGFHRTPERDWSPAPGVDLLGFRLDV
jgi:ribosomal protein S18 acetylase RimI-like enzyme